MFKQTSTKRLRSACLSQRHAVNRNYRRSLGRAFSSKSEIHATPNPATQSLKYVLVGAVACAGFFYTSARMVHAEQAVDASPVTKNDIYASTCSLEGMPAANYNTTENNINAAQREFEKLLGKERVDVSLGARISHSSTEWSEAPRGELDRYHMIVKPRTTEEVSSIAKICHKRRIPMTAFSGGTSLEGTLAATQGGVCVDFALMNKVIEIRKKDVDATVQPGVGYEELNDQLAKDGLFFPPDPGPGAQIGGMVAQGCSGTNAFRYGTMKDWVLGLTVVLADGTIVKTRGRPRKSSSGYNLTQLMVGSEGTLGFVTEAHLKLTSKPENERVAVAAFPSTQKAVDVAVKVVQSGMPIEAMELLCDVSMRAVNSGGYCDKEYPEKPMLFFKFANPDESTIETQIDRVKAFAKGSGCESFEFSRTDEEREALWAARKTFLWSLLTLKNDPSDEFLSTDTAVPVSKLGQAVDEAKKLITDQGLLGACIGHVGDGNFHTGILYPASQKERAGKVLKEIQRLAIKFDGTVTGEHGIGYVYRDMVVEELGQPGVDMMRQIKLALDPLCLMNPDKLFTLKIEN